MYTFYKNNKRLLIWLAIIVVVVLLWQFVSALKSHQQSTNADVARRAGVPIPVSMVVVESNGIHSIAAAECDVKESMRVALSASMGGKVVKVLPKVGDVVLKDQLLVKLDDTVLNAQLANIQDAKATVETLKNELIPYVSNLRDLKNQSLVSVVDLLEAIDKQRRAELDLIRVRKDIITGLAAIKSTELVTPITGMVTNLKVAAGMLVRQNDEVLVVSRMDPLLLECEFEEESLATISGYDTAEANFSAFRGKVYPVDIDSILPSVHRESKAIVVQFALANNEYDLLLGMKAVVRVHKHVVTIKIPAISLINVNGDSANVFVVDDNKVAHLVTITTGQYAEGYVEVLSGLSSDQYVVVVGQGSLQDGDSVIESGEQVSVVNIDDKALFPQTSR